MSIGERPPIPQVIRKEPVDGRVKSGWHLPFPRFRTGPDEKEAETDNATDFFLISGDTEQRVCQDEQLIWLPPALPQTQVMIDFGAGSFERKSTSAKTSPAAAIHIALGSQRINAFWQQATTEEGSEMEVSLHDVEVGQILKREKYWIAGTDLYFTPDLLSLHSKEG